MATINSTSFSGRAGSGTISISHGSLTNSGSETMEVSDIGTLSLEFDLEEDSDSASSVYITPEKFTFKAFDGLSGGTSLFDRIDTDLSSTDEMQVSLSFTTDGGRSWTDSEYLVTKNQMEYDRTMREVTFEAYLDLTKFTTTISSVFTSHSADVYTFDDGDGATTRDCMPTREFLDNAMFELFGATGNIVQTHSFEDNPLVDGNDTWVVFKDHDAGPFDQVDLAVDAVMRIAACDGSVIGSILGYNFIVNRLNTNSTVTLTEDDVLDESLTIRPGLQNYRALSCWWWSFYPTDNVLDWSSHGFAYGSGDNLNEDANKELHVSFFMLELQPASWNSTSTQFDDNASDPQQDTTTDISEDAQEGQDYLEVDSDPGLTDGDHIWVIDKRQLYEFDSYSSNTVFLKSPLRRDIDANFSDGTAKSIFEEIGTAHNGVAERALECYKKAYGADGSRLIEFTILDIDTLAPYQTVGFDSSWPDLLQGQTYRPSMLEYDLKNDIIKVKAYQIG